jgi:hypothetical protein
VVVLYVLGGFPLEGAPSHSIRITVNESIQSPDIDEETYGLRDVEPEQRPENPAPRRRADSSVKLYVALWLPGAGALLAYAVTRGSFWAGFVGIELLLVGLYTLAKL